MLKHMMEDCMYLQEENDGLPCFSEELIAYYERAKPTLWWEVCICFDWDYPVEEMNQVFGVTAARLCRQSRTRINPLTHEKNPGYWQYDSDKIRSFDCDPAFDTLHEFICAHQDVLQKMFCRYHASNIFLRIRVRVNGENQYPAIRLPRNLMEDAISIHALIDIEIENEYFTPSKGDDEIELWEDESASAQ